MWSLKRTVQCSKCPWKVTSNPHDIPDGYSVDNHKSLEDTIARNTDVHELLGSRELNVMACHEFAASEEVHCIGWLYNQLNNNNILLRLDMLYCSNISEMRVIGEQHLTFEDTLPDSLKED